MIAAFLLAGCQTTPKRNGLPKDLATFPSTGPFATYDRAVVKKIQARWYQLIDKYGIYSSTAVVEVKFQLCSDGTIQNIKIGKNSGGVILSLFCTKAIAESAPFDPLSDDLYELVGDDPRDVTFTFYY